VNLVVELVLEDDGRWIADVVELPGVMVYGVSREDAFVRAQALAFHVLAEKRAHGELAAADVAAVTFTPAARDDQADADRSDG
jgi:predicted RNase H-like HicB family nuclease